MNNLQHLYEGNDDFRAFVTNHLVVFEKWYRDDLGGERIEDDIEADRWLMAPSDGSDYNDGKLPEPCLRLDFGGREYRSIETGDGTGFVQLSNNEWIDRDELECKMAGLICSLSNGKISKPYVDNAVISSVITEEFESAFDEEHAQLVNDLETTKLYASKVRDLLIRAYKIALHYLGIAPNGKVHMRDLEKMDQLHKDMLIVGIEVE